MPVSVVANEITWPMRALNPLDETQAISGLSTISGPTNPDFQVILLRQSGSTYVLGSEPVTIVEVGTTGHYVFRFTPTLAGLYMLQVYEKNALSEKRYFNPQFEVLPAGAVLVPSFANCYCSQADVERWAELTFGSGTQVTVNEVAAFCQMRANVIEAKVSAWGLEITPATPVSTRMAGLLRESNAIGAAQDSCLSWYARVRPVKTDRVDYLQRLWVEFMGGPADKGSSILQGTLEAEVRGAIGGMVITPYTEGEVLSANETTITDFGLEDTDMGREW